VSQGVGFIKSGARRISEALEFVRGENSPLIQQYERERLGWNLFYDTLSATEGALTRGERFSLELRKKAEAIINQCSLRVGSTAGNHHGY
jgi:hypothetical protein